MSSEQLRTLLARAVAGDIHDPAFDPGESIGRPHRAITDSASHPKPSSAKKQRIDAEGLQVLEEIGRGGMGVVWKAVQGNLQREVAVKTLKASNNAADEAAFVSESMVTALLEHPNVVPVHDLVATDDGGMALSMKRVDGMTWHALLHPANKAQRKSAEAYTRRRHLGILMDVCDAIAFAHSRGILHCDLKPSNVMVGEFGEVLVMDWGMALAFNPKRMPKAFRSVVIGTKELDTPRGTPGFLSPEMVRSRGELLGPHSDVYLLGGILFEVLTGKQPHGGASIYEVVKNAADGNIEEFPADCEAPEELRAIVRKAMALRPKDRYQSAVEFQTALRTYTKHRDSLRISDAADACLDEYDTLCGPARYGNAAYSLLGEAIAGYRQSLLLWQGNSRAQDGEAEARELYAQAALEAGDFELAKVQAQGLNTDVGRMIQEQSRTGAALRQKAQKSLRRLRKIAVVAAALIIVGLTTGLVMISSERQRANEQAERSDHLATVAETQRKLAEVNLESARVSEAKAVENARRVNEEASAKLRAMEQREAERARADKQAALASANREEADANAKEADRQSDRADNSLALANRRAEEAAEAALRAQEAERDAIMSARQARADAAAKDESLREVQRVSDKLLLDRLSREGKTLMATAAPKLIALEQWLASAQRIVGRMRDHENALMLVQISATRDDTKIEADVNKLERLSSRLHDIDELVASASSRGSQQIALSKRRELGKSLISLQSKLSGRLSFPSADARWRFEVLRDLVSGLRKFTEPHSGLLAQVESKVERLTKSDKLAVAGYAAEWKKALRVIANSRVYGRLSLQPQAGLVPLGKDPSSGLQEFLHLPTHRGEVPKRGRKAKLTLTEDTGLIFVLLPGGKVRHGRQSRGNLDRDTKEMQQTEGPAHEVQLDPFFMSKYEMTQSQWLRLTGKNPSHYAAGQMVGRHARTGLHPVELLTWADTKALNGAGLALPTEVQWEYGARGGTNTFWFSGDDRQELPTIANLADESHALAKDRLSATSTEAWNDGFPMHAPVGSFAPNPFGLYDVIGNVAELCDGPAGSYEDAVAPATGLRLSRGENRRVCRGGSFRALAPFARSAYRKFVTSRDVASTIGVRPMRPLHAPKDSSSLWKAAKRRVAGSKAYRYSRITPRPDLIPLGPDPLSGLEEFLHEATHTGPIPARDSQGQLICGETTGLIFVLLPSGKARLGGNNQAASRDVKLKSFYIAKHEMTQHQWQALVGASPSKFGPDAHYNRHQHDMRHPVENVSQADCQALRSKGLILPTPDQWEYAARAGSDEAAASAGAAKALSLANLADAQYRRMYNRRAAEEWDDGFIMHAPVGTFPPNPFGLHDTLGNVREWTSKVDVSVGGSFADMAKDARTDQRWKNPAGTKDSKLGLRPVLP